MINFLRVEGKQTYFSVYWSFSLQIEIWNSVKLDFKWRLDFLFDKNVKKTSINKFTYKQRQK